MTLYVLDGDLRPVPIADAPVLILSEKAGPRQLTGLRPAAVAGASSEWLFEDPALAGHVDGARFRLVIAGVTYTPDFPHHH